MIFFDSVDSAASWDRLELEEVVAQVGRPALFKVDTMVDLRGVPALMVTTDSLGFFAGADDGFPL